MQLHNIVDNFLDKNFGHILNYELTAKLEKELDMIANSNTKSTKVIADFYNQLKPTLIKLQKEKSKTNNGKRLLGTDDNGNNIYALVAKYGPAVQLEAKHPSDNKYACLNNDQSIDTITFQDAIILLEFPKNLGKYKNNDVFLNKGKYGPYIKYSDTNILTYRL